MKVLTEKVDWLFEEKGEWIYQIHLNAFFEMTIKVQRKKDYEEDPLANYAMATCTVADFNMLTVDELNNIFTWLKTRVDRYGYEYELNLKHFYSSKLHTGEGL